jgi:hypothetical protein
MSGVRKYLSNLSNLVTMKSSSITSAYAAKACPCDPGGAIGYC